MSEASVIAKAFDSIIFNSWLASRIGLDRAIVLAEIQRASVGREHWMVADARWAEMRFPFWQPDHTMLVVRDLLAQHIIVSMDGLDSYAIDPDGLAIALS